MNHERGGKVHCFYSSGLLILYHCGREEVRRDLLGSEKSESQCNIPQCPPNDDSNYTEVRWGV